MDYLVELKVDSGFSLNGELRSPNQGNSLFVRVIADSKEEAVKRAEDAWAYDAISVGATPPTPTNHPGYSARGDWRYPVRRLETIEVTVGEEKI